MIKKINFLFYGYFGDLELDREEESLVLFMQSTFWAGISMLVVVFMIYILCYNYVPRDILQTWLLFSFFSMIFQMLLCWYNLKKLEKQKNMLNINNIIRQFYFMTIFTVTALSSISFLLFRYLSLFQISIITLILIFIVVASLLATLGIKKLYYPYAIPIYTSTILFYGKYVFLEKNLIIQFISFTVIAVIFLVFMFIFADYLSRLIEDSYDIRFRERETNKKLEKALEVSEVANNSKLKFLVSASHDLRQPVHALSLLSSSLKLRPLEPIAEDISESIASATTILSRQLDALFDISQLDSNEFNLDISVHDIKPLLEDMYKEFHCQFNEKNLLLEIKTPKQIIVATDILLIARVFQNLLSNAYKYTNQGKVSIEVLEKENTFYINFIDTGMGLSSEHQLYIFDEFYQVENHERDREKGLGIGLAIVKRICHKLNIEITVDSNEGEGSTFGLIIPKVNESIIPSLAVNEREELANGGITYSVLIVDDDPMALKATQSIMQALGADVYIAGSKKEALEIISNHKIEILLTDYRLKGSEDGLSVIKAAEKIDQNIKSIIISGDAHSAALRNAKKLNISVMSKPLQISDLIVKCKKLFDE